MGIIQIIKIVLKFLPQLVDLIKYLDEQISNGIEEAQIKKQLSAITLAFAMTYRPSAARALDDVFIGKPK